MVTVDSPHRPIVLIGPTAGGKTSVAIGIANALECGGECVSADSMQVYRGMDIGTATPTPAEQGGVPHHLLNIADPGDSGFTVDQWLTMANAAVGEIQSRGRWPIVVGGTNLYVQAFLYGLMDGPEPDAVVRDRLAAMSDERLRARLCEVDEASASRIHANDRRRTQRAVEVFELTGTPLSSLQTQWNTSKRPHREAIVIGLEWSTEAINRRINDRVRSMVALGLFEEVQGLYARGDLGLQAAEGVGYKQVIEAIEGRITREEAIEQIKIRSRRLAKQQRTWLRRFRTLPEVTWIDSTDKSTESIVVEALLPIRSASSHGGPASGDH